MDVLVTGATGQVGYAIVRRLVERGDRVRALVRDVASAARLLPEEVEPVGGDVTVPASLPRALAGCELVFNAMGLPEQWLPDPGTFERVNAQGTANVVRAAREAGVRRVVHTSTIDVFDAPAGGSFDESSLAGHPKATPYERSKQQAEELALAERGGLELVIVNPATVYGPSPAGSFAFDRSFVRPLARGLLPVLPPGGCGLVFAAGLAEGQLLAAERGRDGERYILSDCHAGFGELAEMVVRIAGRGRVPPTMPLPVARALAAAGEAAARLVRRPPLLARGQLQFLLWDARPVSARAESELGWRPTPLADGIARSLEALNLLPRGAQGAR
ncbi:MAG TPA: NAD-dependent epimerase/dehydratase family protein [Gaiellaceae bacterium]|nr:NAD-dependent epimerase/dehydratase family protein [Gaiellaceae bacterium]